MRKPTFCICENKDADQLHGGREADQRLCFHYTDSTIPLLSKSEISSLKPSSVGLQPGLCGTWSETPKTGFLTTRLISYNSNGPVSGCCSSVYTEATWDASNTRDGITEISPYKSDPRFPPNI